MVSQQELESQSALDEPLTARELAEAVTSLEVKKSGLNGRPHTIRLGDAISQLDIDASPEELIAEVQELRATRQEQLRLGLRFRRRARVLAALCGLVTLLVGIEWWEDRQNTAPVPSIASPTPVVQAVSQSEPYPHLRDVPNGLPVGVEYPTIADLAVGKDLGQIRVDARMSEDTLPQDGKIWRIEKTGDRFQVHAWAEQSEALRAANGQEAVVYSNPLPHGTLSALVLRKLDVRRFRGGDPMLFNPTGGAYTAVRLKAYSSDSVPSS
jgi:hypothetical protein